MKFVRPIFLVEFLKLLNHSISPRRFLTVTELPSLSCKHLQGGPKNRIPSFIFGITLVIQHRF